MEDLQLLRKNGLMVTKFQDLQVGIKQPEFLATLYHQENLGYWFNQQKQSSLAICLDLSTLLKSLSLLFP